MSFSETFFEKYGAFCTARNAALAAEGVPKQAEPQVAYALRVTRFVAPHRRTNDDIDQKFEAARRAGRDLIRFVKNNQDALWAEERSMASDGYAGLLNAYTFTAPLDALNWRVMKNADSDGKHADVEFVNWGVVAAMNNEAEDIHVDLLAIVENVQARVGKGTLAKDPFPVDIIRDIRAGCGELPASLNAQQAYVNRIRGDA